MRSVLATDLPLSEGAIMSDQTESPAAGEATAGDTEPAGEAKPPLAVSAQYIKDLSFEAPNTPAVLGRMQRETPEIGINIDVRATGLQDGIYEVVLHIKSECKIADTVAFIVELSYGGVFSINVPAEQIQPVLLIECPRLLFPFARNIVADATRDGGFPPLMLGPVDFISMYRNQLQKQQQDATGEGGAPGADAGPSGGEGGDKPN